MTSTEWAVVIYLVGFMIAVIMGAFAYNGENKDNGSVNVPAAMVVLIEACLSWVLVMYLILLKINQPRHRPGVDQLNH